MSALVLMAPLKGWVSALEEAPDAVFAERMLGDGLAIDPLDSTLHAPCDATVVSVHRAGHAVTLRAENGAEILMHIGLETVALNGEGFEAFVREGQAVRAGDRLIGFDLRSGGPPSAQPDHARGDHQSRRLPHCTSRSGS